MPKCKLTISFKGSELAADKRDTMLEVLRFTVRKEKAKPHTLILFGASPKNIDADLIAKAIKKAKANMVVTDVQVCDEDA